MSVEASRWAMQADVLKSSSKLVLLNLAQLVRYDAEDWTAFASIEYLAKVTHLNRKTVIDALARLRDMGAIQDTGRRAGDNRSSVIYRLCPRAVPTVDLASSQTLAGAPASRPERQPTLALELQVDLEPDWQPELAPASEVREEPQLCDAVDNAPVFPAAVPSSEETVHGASSTETWDGEAPRQVTEFALEPATATAAPPRRRQNRQPVAGAGATKLPAGWSLPEKWRLWTHQNRPQWAEERVDAMAATFSAYWRSRVGDTAFSADWFESWRLWVFRERAPQKARGRSWQESWSGIVAKGKALSLYRAPNEPEAYFKLRVFEAAGVPPPH